jgi:hypothetical protein
MASEQAIARRKPWVRGVQFLIVTVAVYVAKSADPDGNPLAMVVVGLMFCLPFELLLKPNRKPKPLVGEILPPVRSLAVQEDQNLIGEGGRRVPELGKPSQLLNPIGGRDDFC